MSEVAKDGGHELSQAEKDAIAESFKGGTPEERIAKLKSAEIIPISLLQRLANPEKPHTKEANGSESKEKPKAEKAKDAVEELAQSAGAKLGGPKAEAKAKPKIEAPRPVEPPIFDEKDLTRVPGIVGRLTDWMEAASLYPNRPLALGASLVTVGTLIGQRVAGPTQGSTHLYGVGLGASSSGKQQVIDSAKEALSEIGALPCIGPGDFRSSPAVVETLKVQRVFCSFIDEYGLVLQRIGDKRGGGFEYDVISVFQQLWGHQWVFYNTPASARVPSRRIFAPAFSLFGLSVPEQFYSALTFKQITGGLLNRHLIIRGIDRPLLQDRADGSWRLPAALKEELKGFYRPRQKPKLDMDKPLEELGDDVPFDPEIRMRWGAGAQRAWTDLIAELRKEPDNLRSNLFSRVPDMTVRIATIIAFGRYSTTVDVLDVELARAVALESAEFLHDGVLKYTIDPQGFASLCQKIIDFTSESKDKFISYRNLKRRCRALMQKATDLDAALKHLVQGEELLRYEVRQNPKGGQPSPGYALVE